MSYMHGTELHCRALIFVDSEAAWHVEADIAIDLIFNKVTALKQFNNWRKCLEEIDDINAQKKMNRLAEAKNSVMQSNMGKQETGQCPNNGINSPAMPEPRMPTHKHLSQ